MPSKKKKASGSAAGGSSKSSSALGGQSTEEQQRGADPSSEQRATAGRPLATLADTRLSSDAASRRQNRVEPPRAPRTLLGKLWARVQLYKFQFDVTFGLYVLDWWEQQLLYLLVFLLLWFLAYQMYRSCLTLYASFTPHAKGLNGNAPGVNGAGPS